MQTNGLSIASIALPSERLDLPTWLVPCLSKLGNGDCNPMQKRKTQSSG